MFKNVKVLAACLKVISLLLAFFCLGGGYYLTLPIPIFVYFAASTISFYSGSNDENIPTFSDDEKKKIKYWYAIVFWLEVLCLGSIILRYWLAHDLVTLALYLLDMAIFFGILGIDAQIKPMVLRCIKQFRQNTGL